jgi:uncharacterized membrane protein YbhN (UPF0104 family)
LPAAGAGGLALGAWVLHRRGMPPERIASRSVAFFLLTSAVNAAALALLGLGLASGVLSGPAPVGLTLIPALVAAGAIALVLAVPRLDLARRGTRQRRPRRRLGRIVDRVGRSLAAGVEEAVGFLRSGSPFVYGGAVGYWAFDNAVLWLCFRALGHPPPIAVVAVAYLIGQLGAAVPLPAGVGGVDLGLIGALVLFHVPAAAATAAVLSYRTFQLWLPALMGGVALARLPSVFAIDGSRAS